MLPLVYFIALLGRNRCIICTRRGVEIPSDISDIIYKEFGRGVPQKEAEIRRDLISTGHKIR